MPLLRLLLAFALTIAIPLQGLAAATCMCKLRQARAAASTAGYSADGGGGLASRLVASVSLAHGAPEMAPGSMSTHAKSAGPHGGAPPAHGDKRIITAGRYADKYVIHEGRWVISERIFSPELSWDFPAPIDTTPQGK